MTRYAPQNVADRPVLLREGEYERNWKPYGWRLIVIGPTATWREEWGMWEAIRDIVQNCLDEAEGYTFGYDHDGFWIADKGKGVAVADFLLGPPKLKPDWARGKFGEGMKIASLALLRQGHPVHVETVKRELWMVFTEQEVNGRVKSLAALWKPNGTRTGTTFHIIGYRGSAYERNFAVNLPRSLILAEVPSPITKPRQRYNQLIRAEGPASSVAGGTIYCRDIYLQDITSPFSYNLWGFELAPDRHGPQKESDMWIDAGRLWAGVIKVPLLAEFLGMVTDPPITMRTAETLHVNMSFMGRDPTQNRFYTEIMTGNASLWQQAWNRMVGKDAVLRQDERLDSMVIHLGYRSVSVQYDVRSTLSSVIQTDKELVKEMAARLSEAEIIPDKRLIPQQIVHLELARAIASDFAGVGSVSAAIIPPASDLIGRTAGIYEFDTAAIKVHAEMLHRAGDTIGVMVHELGHHIAYLRTNSKEAAGDLTPEHGRAMEYVSGRIFQLVSQGRYDEYLKKAVW